MDQIAEHSTKSDRPEELWVPLGEPEKAVNTTPARGVPKPLFIAVAALAAALGIFAALLCFFGSGYQRNLALAHADQDYMRQQLEEAGAGLTAAQEELARTQGQLAQAREELAQAQDTIGLLEEYSLAAPDGTVPEYTRLYPEMYVPEWEGERITGGKVCCLTFDDGPSANTDRVLDILDRYGVKATFFVVGRTGAADQERMKKIVAAGHSLAIHSWTHNYGKIYASVDAFLEDFHQLYQWIYDVTGTYPQVFRFPGGSLNSYNRGTYQEIIAEMTRRGFVYFDWNASAQDATVRPRPAGDIAADCLKGVGKDLAVVLCHDSAARTTTVDALPAVIQGYQNAGYTFSALHPGVRPITFGYPRLQ